MKRTDDRSQKDEDPTNQEFVSKGIEDSSKLGNLLVASRPVAIDPVGSSCQRKEDQRHEIEPGSQKCKTGNRQEEPPNGDLVWDIEDHLRG